MKKPFFRKNVVFSLIIAIFFVQVLVGCNMQGMHVATSEEYILPHMELSEGNAVQDLYADSLLYTVNIFVLENSVLSYIVSGVIISYDGIILTSIENAQARDVQVKKVQVYASFGGRYPTDCIYPLSFVASDAETGLTLLRFSGEIYHRDAENRKVKGVEYIPALCSADTEIGTRCYAVADVDLLYTGITEIAPQITEGIVGYTAEKTFHFTAPVSYGGLGGCILDENGYCIGFIATNVYLNGEDQMAYYSSVVLETFRDENISWKVVR